MLPSQILSASSRVEYSCYLHPQRAALVVQFDIKTCDGIYRNISKYLEKINPLFRYATTYEVKYFFHLSDVQQVFPRVSYHLVFLYHLK